MSQAKALVEAAVAGYYCLVPSETVVGSQCGARAGRSSRCVICRGGVGILVAISYKICTFSCGVASVQY